MPGWSLGAAERHLRSLAWFGVHFGLDRMHRLMAALDFPQRSFPCIHVVGTNGKTSTTRMVAAILERHGLRTGAYTSPHLRSYRERMQIGGRDLDPSPFAAAVQRAARAAERVSPEPAPEDRVTQFELLTAAAFCAFQAAEVEVAVVEAGLGGRLDASNVIDAPVVALTNVALEHTRLLGPTTRDIAEEKLAVVPAGATLVLGSDLDGEAYALATRIAARRGLRVLHADSGDELPELRARGDFQRRNFALARAVAEAHLLSRREAHRAPAGGFHPPPAGSPLQASAVREAAASLEVPGRLQLLAGEPPLVLDGAHNPHAVRALVRSLVPLLGGRPAALVLGVLDDKDATAMLRSLLPACERAWFTTAPSDRALDPAALLAIASELGFARAGCEPSPSRALAKARAWARDHGGVVLATGSVYLVGLLLEHLSRADEQAPVAGGESGAR